MTASIDTADLAARLEGTAPPEDPRAVSLPAATAHWPAELVASLAGELKPAGVLIPIVERRAGLTVLLTERSAELKHHAGQIAFPGGRMEPGDPDIVQTALRETHEEVGIAPERVTVVGYLPPLPTVTGYAVTPVIGVVSGAVTPSIDTSEVSSAFEVPLAFVLDSANARAGLREFQGRKIPVVEFRYAGYRIWGATAHMLVELRKIVLK